MTEEQAKEKWCPMLSDQQDRCIASDCMAWVQDKSVWCNPDGTEPTPAQMAERTPEEAGLITVTYGHCGLVK